MSIETAQGALRAILGERLSTRSADLAAHGASESHFPPAPPEAVAWPESTAEVAAIMRICTLYDVPVVAYGAGTSLEGQTSALRGGLSLDFGRMARLKEVSATDMLAVVEPGLTREELNRELRATGLFFSVDPGANASLGGMAATRASGTTAVRHGTMRDNVAALEVVLADGRVIRTGSRAVKSASGYDLTALMLGSEGTLGLITELTLRLQPVPEAQVALVCAFDRLESAVAAVVATMQAGLPMARIEFVDALTVRAFNRYAGTELPEAPHLFAELAGSPAAVAEQAELFGEIAADHGATGLRSATTSEARRDLWSMRHQAYWACLKLRPGAGALTTDACVPMSRLAEAVRAARDDIAASPLAERLLGPILGHVGDGNFHSMLLIEPGNAEELAEARRLAGRMAERALAMGGTVTGEHGIGQGKLAYMPAEHGEGWQVMRAIKLALDPQGLLNPGKLLPQPR